MTLPRLSRSNLMETRLPIAPPSEQHRIVEAIESNFAKLDQATTALARVRRTLSRFRVSTLRSGLDGQLVPRRSKWKVGTLFEVAEDLDGRRVPVNATERQKRVGRVPYYGATGQVGWIDGFLFDEELVLLGEDGVDFLDSFKPKAYIIRGKSWVNNHAHVLRVNPGVMLSQFLAAQLNIADYSGLVNGTTRLKLTKSAMRRIQLVIPPLDEQAEVVDAMERLMSIADEANEIAMRGEGHAGFLREAILASGFSGTLSREGTTSSSVNRHDANSYRTTLPESGRSGLGVN